MASRRGAISSWRPTGELLATTKGVRDQEFLEINHKRSHSRVDYGENDPGEAPSSPTKVVRATIQLNSKSSPKTEIALDQERARRLISDIRSYKKQPRRLECSALGDVTRDLADKIYSFALDDLPQEDPVQRDDYRVPASLSSSMLKAEVPEACVPDTSVLKNTLEDFSAKTGIDTASLESLLPTIMSVLSHSHPVRTMASSALHEMHVSQCKSVVATVLAADYKNYSKEMHLGVPRLSFERFISDYIDSMSMITGDSLFRPFDISETPLQSSDPVGAAGPQTVARAAAIVIALARSMRRIDEIVSSTTESGERLSHVVRENWHECYTTVSMTSLDFSKSDNPQAEDLYRLDVIGAQQGSLSDDEIAVGIFATNPFLADDIRKVRASPMGPVVVFAGELYASSESLSSPAVRDSDGDLVGACRALSLWIDPHQRNTNKIFGDDRGILLNCVDKLRSILADDELARDSLSIYDLTEQEQDDVIRYARVLVFADTSRSLFSIDYQADFDGARLAVFAPVSGAGSRNSFSAASYEHGRKNLGYMQYLKQAMETRTLQPCHLLCAFMLRARDGEGQFAVDVISVMERAEERIASTGFFDTMVDTAKQWSENAVIGILSHALEPAAIASLGLACLDMTMMRGFVRRVLSPNPLSAILALLSGKPSDPRILFRPSLSKKDIQFIYEHCEFDSTWEVVTLKDTGEQRLVRSIVSSAMDNLDPRWERLSQTLCDLAAGCLSRTYTAQEIDAAQECVREFVVLEN